MSLNTMSVFRIDALLAVTAGCAWGAGQYLDVRAFERRNADAIALCGSLAPGMAIADAESRARGVSGAAVAAAADRLVARIPGQSPCVAEIFAGHVRSAAVARPD